MWRKINDSCNNHMHAPQIIVQHELNNGQITTCLHRPSYSTHVFLVLNPLPQAVGRSDIFPPYFQCHLSVLCQNGQRNLWRTVTFIPPSAEEEVAHFPSRMWWAERFECIQINTGEAKIIDHWPSRSEHVPFPFHDTEQQATTFVKSYLNMDDCWDGSSVNNLTSWKRLKVCLVLETVSVDP